MRWAGQIAPIILAAGDSKRMGFPKALLPLGQEIFLTRILRLLAGTELATPRLLLGRNAATIAACIGDYPVEIIVNPDPDRGQLSSIQLGLSNLDERFCAALIWPVDQPAISAALLRQLIDLFLAGECRVAVPLHAGHRGHPAIFHRDLFYEFMNAPLDKGAKGIISRHEKVTAFLPTEEDAAINDIDTPEEYRRLTGQNTL